MAYPTNPIYKLIKDPLKGIVNQVKKQNGNIITIIPFNEANTSYQEYLSWVAKGNTPEEAD
tara:strand:- start:1445 stop:1627 length:183 start_codon:yes stop_codon:yes gene_type:complete